MKELSYKQKKIRIVARGEHSGHCHVVVGDVEIEEKKDRIIITVGEDSNASLKHLLEKPWMEKQEEVWTKEHKEIPFEPGQYTFIIQEEHDPYKGVSRRVTD